MMSSPLAGFAFCVLRFDLLFGWDEQVKVQNAKLKTTLSTDRWPLPLKFAALTFAFCALTCSLAGTSRSKFKTQRSNVKTALATNH
jgi:hypothetical protein